MSYFDVAFNAPAHKGDLELDENIIASENPPLLLLPRPCLSLTINVELLPKASINDCRGYSKSYRNQTARIDIEVSGERKSYFLKVTVRALLCSIARY